MHDRELSDIADSSAASYWPDIASELDSVEDCAREVCHEAGLIGLAIGITIAAALISQTIERCGGVLMNVNAHESLERAVMLLADSRRPRLDIDVLIFATGLYARLGLSGTKLAEKHGITRAAFSKRCKIVQKKLGIPPSRGMKSEKACQTYSLTNGKI